MGIDERIECYFFIENPEPTMSDFYQLFAKIICSGFDESRFKRMVILTREQEDNLLSYCNKIFRLIPDNARSFSQFYGFGIKVL